MIFLERYSLSLICGALVCSLFAGLIREGIFQKQLKLLCGLFLTLTMIRPLVQLKLPELDELLMPYENEAESAAAWGTSIYNDAVSEGIQREIEAYICSKAEAHQTSLQVQVHLNNHTPPLPDRVTLEGNVAPEVKKVLQEMMEQDLSIPKEHQIWIGQR